MNDGRIQKLEADITELKRVLSDLQSANTVTPEFARVISSRNIGPSVKAANSENVTINEAGSGSPTVLDNPDGFDQATIGGVVHYYPYFL